MLRKSLFWSLGLTMALFADTSGGLRARRSAADYAAQAKQKGLTVGAAALSASEATRIFSKDLGREYLVIEVGVFPGAAALDLQSTDFTLRVGANQTVLRPLRAGSVVSALYRQSPTVARQPRSNVDVIAGGHIGYESGPVYDPATGRNRNGGVIGGGGVGVSNGPAYPQSYPNDPDDRYQNRRKLQADLEDSALPEGNTVSAVAGYLYFPLPISKRRKVAFELLFDTPEGRLTLPLPAADK